MRDAAVIQGTCETIAERRRIHPSDRALLVAVSGIDASGKGTVAATIASELEERGLSVALIGLDPWHEPMRIRFSDTEPAQHFYRHAFRFDALFSEIVDPLASRRSVRTTAKLIDPASDVHYSYSFHYEDIDIVLLEGIFLFKRSLCARYDLRIWIECSFETALERALSRGQEGLGPDETRRDYERIYFPAQRIHFALDDPRSSADIMIENDARVG
jgi:uridine kinase